MKTLKRRPDKFMLWQAKLFSLVARAVFVVALLAIPSSAQQIIESNPGQVENAPPASSTAAADAARAARAAEDHQATMEMLRWFQEQKKKEEAAAAKAAAQAGKTDVPGTMPPSLDTTPTITNPTMQDAPNTSSSIAPTSATPLPPRNNSQPLLDPNDLPAVRTTRHTEVKNQKGGISATAVLALLLIAAALYAMWSKRAPVTDAANEAKTAIKKAAKARREKPVQVPAEPIKKVETPPRRMTRQLPAEAAPPLQPSLPYSNERTPGLLELERFFENRVAPVRASAAATLGRIRNTAAVPILLRGIKDDDVQVQAAVATSLAAYQNVYQFPAGTTANIKSVMNKASVDTLEKFAAQSTFTVQPQAAKVKSNRLLNELPKAAVIKPSEHAQSRWIPHVDDTQNQNFEIIHRVNDAPLATDAPITAATVIIRNDGGEFEAVPNPALKIVGLPLEPPADASIQFALAQITGGDAPNDRLEAARTLAQHSYATVVNALVIAALHDEDASVRAAAVSSLGEINHISTFSTIIIALGDDEPSVQAAAARAVSNMSYSRSYAYDRCMVEESAATLKQMASDLLKTGLAMQAVGNLASRHPEQVKEAAAIVKIVAKAGDSKLLEEISHHHEDSYVRDAAISIMRNVA